MWKSLPLLLGLQVLEARVAFSDLTDEELMIEFQSGNPDALSFLLKRLLPKLASIARKLSPDKNLADDSLQEALATVWRKAGQFNGDSKVVTWLYVIIRNACIDIYRKEEVRTRQNISDETLLELGDETNFVDTSLTQMVIRKAVFELPEELRDPVCLVFLSEYSVEEASGLLGIPAGTIKSRCSRGRALLAEKLSDLGPKK
jgi:RNA polymerase sigma-70 factor (ECF subfamily)